MPTLIYFNGFESGDSAGLQALTGTASVQGTVKRLGDYALRVNPTTNGTGSIRAFGLNANGTTAGFDLATAVVGFAFRVATLPAASSEEIARVDTTGGTQKATIRITSAGLLAIYAADGTTLIATSSSALVVNTWYYIEWTLGTGVSSAYTVKVNGTTFLNGTSDFGVTNSGGIRLGKVTDRNSQTVDFYYDDIYVADSSLGQPYVARMDGNSDGNYTAWTSSSGLLSPSKYSDAIQGPHDSDTTYLSTSTSGNAFTMALESAAQAGIVGTVHGVMALAIVRDEGGASSFQVRIRSGSTDSDTTANDPGSSYVTRQKLASVDPATSAAWQLPALDSLEVGVVAGANVAHRCTALYAMVLYAPGDESRLLTMGVS